MSEMLNKIDRILALLQEDTKTTSEEQFAQKRHDGAKKIAEASQEKGGPAILTYHHFIVKLPYYKKAASGELNFDEAEEEYRSLCKQLAETNYTKITQTKFQELVGKIEVLGELLINSK